jgi:hypothetical protein
MGESLERIMEAAETLQAVKKSDLHVGDWLLVKTLNSVYTLQAVEGGRFRVSGGWFDRKGLSPTTMTITGCTWGGSVIKIDVVAACGLSLEFGNRLTTSTIQKVVVLQRGCEN